MLRIGAFTIEPVTRVQHVPKLIKQLAMLQLINFTNNLFQVVSSRQILIFRFPSFEYAYAFAVTGNKR